MLFLSSYDHDYNYRNEELKFDSQGYFLFDHRSKPAKPVAKGIPLLLENSDSKQSLNIDMPIILLLPNPRSVHGQQLTFKSLTKSILAMTFLGQNGLDQEVY